MSNELVDGGGDHLDVLVEVERLGRVLYASQGQGGVPHVGGVAGELCLTGEDKTFGDEAGLHEVLGGGLQDLLVVLDQAAR
ncbi:MAG: hypothetical protein L0H79_08540 [Intrasporangium sp.]|uniref:hypothetical protein n=1 Tax=Intrasporangium sp. TaxID=1925024 RepID=UPI0026475DDA|nr:hypothetical protein [Intrasporangium sp.]MDN5795783.1 hypothetical protein [Intrasporangium sp.]